MRSITSVSRSSPMMSCANWPTDSRRRAKRRVTRNQQPAAAHNRTRLGWTIPPACAGKHSSPSAAPPNMTRTNARSKRRRRATANAAQMPAAEHVRSQTAERLYNVLFLCTGNSARSIMGEVILNKIGAGKFHAFSAGSQPRGAVHPRALELLKRLGYATEGLRSKDWREYSASSAPSLDFVFTVCDSAANEVCPV